MPRNAGCTALTSAGTAQTRVAVWRKARADECPETVSQVCPVGRSRFIKGSRMLRALPGVEPTRSYRPCAHLSHWHAPSRTVRKSARERDSRFAAARDHAGCPDRLSTGRELVARIEPSGRTFRHTPARWAIGEKSGHNNGLRCCSARSWLNFTAITSS